MTLEALTRLVDSPWTVILDTWPGEPSLSAELLSRCDWVSPHIAGHSVKARENGSDLLAAAVARWAGVETQVRMIFQIKMTLLLTSRCRAGRLALRTAK